MPGPGGGSRGGGGGRGFGGGFGGGGGGRSFGGGGRGFGGSHHHYYGPRFYGRFFGPRRYYGGGGCLGGLLGLFIAPIILILFAGILFLNVFSSAFGSILTGGEIQYNENEFQDYANSQYAAEFGELDDYEDGLLLVFVVEDEEYYEYAYIAWCGDHINPRINDMFGAAGTEFGNAISSSAINSGSYKYSLDSGIASVVSKMNGYIERLNLSSSYTCANDYKDYKSHVTNKTSLEVTESTVNNALTSFTASTGIPVAVVIADADEVLPRNFDYVSVIIALVLIVIAVVLIVKAIKSNKDKSGNNGSNGNNNNNGNYNNGNSNGYNNNYNNNNYNRSAW